MTGISDTAELAAGAMPRRPGVRERAVSSLRAVPLDLWALAAVVVVAALIRVITIDNQSLWMDEALTAYEAKLPFGAMLTTVFHVETTPPLYYVLVWAWAHLFGTGAVALRSISAIAGVALVPVAYAASRELISRWAGVLAAAFVAVNPFLIWYSQEARGYMLLALLSGVSFLFFARTLREPTRRHLAWWAAVSALAVMTHFFAGFLVAPEGAWLLWRRRDRITLLACAVVAAVQLAMLPLAAADTGHGTGWVASVPPLRRLSRTVMEWGVSILERRGRFAEGLIGGVVAVVLVALLVLTSRERRPRRGVAVAAAVAAFVFVAPLALGAVGQDYFLSRNEIPAVIPVMAVLAGACVLSRWRIVGGLVAGLLLAGFAFSTFYVQTHPGLQRPDWRRVAAALGPAPVPRALLVADGTTADPLKIYLPGVTWVQAHSRIAVVREIDVIGATKRLSVTDPGRPGVSGAPASFGRPITRSVALPGTRLISRVRVANWIVGRFALSHPERVSINLLLARAHTFFRHTPTALLVFFQRPRP